MWRPGSPVLAAASTVIGGGLGPRHWALTATVDEDYDHPSPADHLGELAAAHGLGSDGIGFLTAVDVRRACWAEAEGADVERINWKQLMTDEQDRPTPPRPHPAPGTDAEP